MKNILYIASICMAGLIVSCNDFLTVESPDQLTSDVFWRNQSDAEAGLSAAYSQLEYSIDTWEFAEVKWPVEAYREDIVILGYDALNYPNWVELSNFTYTNGNSQVSSYWWNNYKGISFSNQVIEKAASIPDENIDPVIRAQIINEGHFLRAYYHMKLILNFEQIIIRDKHITNQNDLNKSLATRQDAWDFIINELKTATALPTQHNADNIGRATSGAAYSYLGFAYLTRAYEESSNKDSYLIEALKALDGVKGYELETDFVSMFDGTNKNSKESIFELQYTMSTANGADYRTALHRWIGSAELLGWDEITPSAFLVNEFMSEGEIATTGRYDSRLYSTLFFQSEYFNDPIEKRVYGNTYNYWFQKDGVFYNRPVFRKFMPPTYEALALSRFANNIPLMRYANVLLMKAETLNELDRPLEAIPLINQVRSVHGDMPPMAGSTKQDVARQIEHERIIEFALENFRWYDLRRWDSLAKAMQAAGRTNFSIEKNAFYPVPLTEINSNELIDN